MMNILLAGVGCAGNWATVNAIQKGVIAEEDTMIINSTSKDFPEGYNGKKIILSPDDTGCGKEINIARDYAIDAIKQGKFNLDNINNYSTVIFCTSVEGGTGSGATPLLAKFFVEVFGRNTHIIAFTGFEEDVRGLQNTVEFFKNIDKRLTVQTIRNKAFLAAANDNRFRAEQLANDEMAARIEIMSGKNLIYDKQNIDDTDLLKVVNSPRYMTVEHTYFNKPLIDKNDFNSIVKRMIYNSASVKSENARARKMGIIINFDPASEDAIDFSYSEITKHYGIPFEEFKHRQWDGKKEYIALIVSDMDMPIDEVQSIYDKYIEQSQLINKKDDEFYSATQDMSLDPNNDMFNMIKPVEKTTTSIADFLSNL